MDCKGRELRPPAVAVFFLLPLFLSAGEALNINSRLATGDAVSKLECSRKCESDHCTVPPLLRYGKYCGVMYSGCSGEMPCDGLDACCMSHDACIQEMHNDYLSQRCSKDLLDCIGRFKEQDAPSFMGNKCLPQEVADEISIVIEVALFAGKVLHKP